MPKYVVRHGVMRNLSVLGTRAGEAYARGMQVIIRTQRGIEAGFHCYLAKPVDVDELLTAVERLLAPGEDR